MQIYDSCLSGVCQHLADRRTAMTRFHAILGLKGRLTRNDVSTMNKAITESAMLLVHCDDQPGIVVSITDFIFHNGGNILSLDQHVDSEHHRFFLRVEWDLEKFSLDADAIGGAFESAVATRFGMQWQLHFSSDMPRMGLFVSRLPHCFYDILSRYEAGEWRVEITLLIINHNDFQCRNSVSFGRIAGDIHS